MGLGKTLQAIAFTARVPDSWPVLIICPSSLRLHWAETIKHWLEIPPKDILVVSSESSSSNPAGFKMVHSSAKGSINLDGVFNIISYGLVPKLQDQLMARQFKNVIADESHSLKNDKAKRTNACVPILQKAQYAILLSGTPALSLPNELFKQLQALYPDVYKKVTEYGDRYCKGIMLPIELIKRYCKGSMPPIELIKRLQAFYPDVYKKITEYEDPSCKGSTLGAYKGASYHEELHNLLKTTVMIRRLKKNLLSDLPVKRRQQIFLELADTDMEPIKALFKKWRVAKKKKKKIKSCSSTEKIEELEITCNNLTNKIYAESAQAKIRALLDYLATVIEAGCKFLIFAHHKSMVYQIHRFLLDKKVDCIRIDGGTPASLRQSLVNDFREKDNIRAAALSIKAAGVGLTLTAASTVIFAELAWTPGDLIRAEDRAHRIGQAASVNVYCLLAHDTIDDIIWDAVQNKLENLGLVLDGHEDTMQVAASQSA